MSIRSCRKASVGSAFAILLATGGIASAQGITFNIPSEPLSQALRDYGRESGRQIIFTEDLVQGRISNEVHGALTPDEALRLLLDGTGLIAHLRPTGAVMIERRPAARGVHESVNPTARRTRMSTAPDAAATLGEVVVTAEKRKERLQDVPISIGVVTADEIRQRGLVGAEDYLRGMPGVSEVPGYYGDTIVIRGVETSPGYLSNFASGSPVATYFGETPTSTSAGLAGGSNIDLKLIDIDRVEVLRGPQGTAFGDASLGGAVRVIPTEPKLNRFEGMVAAGYSITGGTGGDNYNTQAVVNLPLINDRLAVRAVGYSFRDTGFIRNVAGSDATFRAYSAEVGQQAVDVQHVGNRIFDGGRITALLQATDNLSVTATFLRQTTELDGQPHAGTSDAATAGLATLGPYEQAVPNLAPEQVLRGENLGILLTAISLSNATAQYDLGWGDLLGTVSHIESGASSVTQLQIPGLPSQRGVGPHRETEEELRLASKLQGPWRFLVGLYGQKTSDSVLFDYWWFQSPTTGLAVLNNGNRYFGSYADQRDLSQKAAYGEVSWTFLPGLTLTGGTRLYSYDRNDHVVTSGLLFGDQDSPSRSHATGKSWRGNLTYKPNADTLVYATFSEGFRLGKPQPGLPQDLCGDGNGIVRGTEGTTNVAIASTRIVNSDTIKNYELGTKLAMLERRLTLSADVYRMDWDGLPVSVNAPAPPAGCGLTYVSNAGKARSRGIEFQADYDITRALRVELGGSYVDATLTQDVPSLAAVAGDRLPGSPKVNGTFAAQYAFSIAGRNAWVRADAVYVGTFYGDLQQTANTKAGGYATVGVSGGITVTHNFNVRLEATNLTNRDSFVFRNFTDTGPQYGYRLRPRTIGLELQASF